MLAQSSATIPSVSRAIQNGSWFDRLTSAFSPSLTLNDVLSTHELPWAPKYLVRIDHECHSSLPIAESAPLLLFIEFPSTGFDISNSALLLKCVPQAARGGNLFPKISCPILFFNSIYLSSQVLWVLSPIIAALFFRQT
jgi:hypothetical protein